MDLEKLDRKSENIKEEEKAKLKELFPSVFNEDKIDFEKLKNLLGEDIDAGRERFGLNWPGKANCMRVIQEPSVATLKPCVEESVDFDSTENLFIEGDNLEVLKLLQKSYFGKVKMIYIDPPYNTGNEFIYPDKYSETLDTYLEYTGQKDSEGKKFATNTETQGRYHSRWLSMMYPRLYLAKNLLKEDGVIFISIDDNEVANLQKICNEIFGEESFIALFVWKSRQNKDNRSVTGASIDHEYILCYGKGIRGSERDITQYKNPDNDPRGDWVSANMVGMLPENLRPNCHYSLVDPSTGIDYEKPKMGWRYDKNTMKNLIDESKILWPKSSDGRPRRKLFISELKDDFTGFSSVVGIDIYTRDGTSEVEGLFGGRVFDFPKPSALIKEMIVQGLDNEENQIVLDFFSGSAPTAHAILDLNKDGSKSRRFIMVQLPEVINQKSEAFKAGYATISDIGKERLRRVGSRIKKELDGELNFGSKRLDLGFRVFKLAKSNFRVWDGETKEDIKEQLEAHVDHIDKESTELDVLYEILFKAGYELTVSINKIKLAKKDVYSVDDDNLLVCLDKKITSELIDALSEKEPHQVILLDEGFNKNDQLKTNAVQTFKAKSKDLEREIVFRTV